MSTEIDVFVRREGERDPAHHRIQDGITVAAFKVIVAGDAAVDLLLFEEDGEEPLPDHHQIRHGGGSRFFHHGRCRHVETTVRYAGKSVRHAFAPGSTLARVKRWAERHLELDAADAIELSLQIAGGQERPDETVHVGSLASCPDCRVTFDLLPGNRINGAPA